MSGLREGAAAEAPAWKLALLERKRAKLAAGMGLERGRGSAPRPGQGPDGREAGPVVAESLGPLRENPFIRLESEQRRRRRRGACELPGPASSPSSPAAESPALAQLLQLYGAMPGIRTIRADNILIIESSDPAEAAQGSALGRRSPLRDLLARRGPPPPPPVTEIRAVQVVVYEPEAPPPPLAEGPDSGLVSRLLQKFDRAAQGKGERGGDGPALPVPPLPGSPAARPAPSPGPQGGGCGGSSVFLQKIGSNSFVVNPRGHRAGLAASPALSNGRTKAAEVVALPPASSAGQRGVAAVSKAVPSSRSPAPSSPPEADAGKPKCEAAAAPETSPQPPTPSSATLDSRPSLLFSSSCSFEIRPAPKPDLVAIPAHDLQARALASLRLNSRNSFLFVPHRKEEPPGPPPPAEALSAAPEEEEEEEKSVPVTYIDEDLVAAMPPLKVLSPRLEGFHVPRESALTEDPDLPTYRPFSAASIPRTSTFTVVPKRKPPAASPELFSRAWVQEEEEEEDQSQRKAQMGALQQESGRLKKRYPTVNEIEVIGGYLSLNKSCMSKSDIQRKKMKISFNETSLQTMFEYPSESSLVEEEEEEEKEEYATEVDEKPAFRIPHPSSTVNSHPINSGLSGYTPKHSLGFNKWQEQQYQKLPSTIGALPQETDQPEQQVMLTPAEKSHLSDFSSEPALYF